MLEVAERSRYARTRDVMDLHDNGKRRQRTLAHMVQLLGAFAGSLGDHSCSLNRAFAQATKAVTAPEATRHEIIATSVSSPR